MKNRLCAENSEKTTKPIAETCVAGGRVLELGRGSNDLHALGISTPHSGLRRCRAMLPGLIFLLIVGSDTLFLDEQVPSRRNRPIRSSRSAKAGAVSGTRARFLEARRHSFWRTCRSHRP